MSDAIEKRRVQAKRHLKGRRAHSRGDDAESQAEAAEDEGRGSLGDLDRHGF